jgi:oxygen-independent coproporphyrinogen-3 oxidase
VSAPRPDRVYLHWPYCARICPYCDFNVQRDRGRTDEQAALVQPGSPTWITWRG